MTLVLLKRPEDWLVLIGHSGEGSLVFSIISYSHGVILKSQLCLDGLYTEWLLGWGPSSCWHDRAFLAV